MLFLPASEPIEKQPTIKSAQASWYKNWELYPIVLFATFLRFYSVNTSEFDSDQALIYRLAYDAVHHGLWPVTNSTASLGFANAPGELYLLMIPAAFSANPIYAYYLVSLLASISVLITYIFTTCYYGRLAGAIATLLYATATIPLYYSRFLWQPNMMYLFVILFMFMLFIGVVERRKGWFAPALILLGILYQTHGTTLTLVVPLFLACCMAFKTIRWRDLLYSSIGLAVVFFPFMLWQLVTHFSDLRFILASDTRPAVLNDDSWMLYRLMISPYDLKYPPSNPLFWTRILMPVTSYLYDVMCYLVIIGCVLALIGAFVLWERQRRNTKQTLNVQSGENAGRAWWNSIPALPPEAGGLLLLCAWQITPLLAMLKHSTTLYPQYMLVVLPGPFILISYILVASGNWARLIQARFWTSLHVVIAVVLAIVTLLQLVNSVAVLRDDTHGYVAVAGYTYYNTLYSQQTMLNDAEHLAQQYHLKRILIGVNKSSEETLFYLSEHMDYPASVFFINQCMVLPSSSDGPAILIVSPSLPASNKTMETFGAHLLKQTAYLNHGPFSIYELPSAQSNPLPVTKQNTFAHDLQFVGAGYQNQTHTSLFTSWSLLRSYPLSDSTTYSYHFTALAQGKQNQKMESTCTFNRAHAGDQLLPLFAVPAKQQAPTALSMSVQSYVTTPDRSVLGPFHLETHRLFNSSPVLLHTLAGSASMRIEMPKNEGSGTHAR